MSGFYKVEIEKHVFFDKIEDGIGAKLIFKYGDLSVNPLTYLESQNKSKEEKTLLRDYGSENKLISIFKRFGFQSKNDSYIQQNEDVVYEFLKNGLDEVKETAEVFYSDDFKDIKIRPTNKFSAGVKINTETKMLELNVNFDKLESKELMELLSSYKLKKKYHRLKSGSFVSLDDGEFQDALEIIEQLNLNNDDISKKVINLPQYRAMYIDSLAREKSGFHFERSSAFKKMVQDVVEPHDLEYELPTGINGTLRDYQKIGFKWLKTLSHYGFGGILADDMGLGKTLQVITFIKSENEISKSPSLVIAPTSLVYNWQEEVKKFAPELKVAVLSGAQSDRRSRLNEINHSDIVVTSYGMLKRDIEHYSDVNFKYCFLDEAQHIKNPNTLNAKSVKQIRAGGYFALTGTPIENTLTELWSIFDYLMPGYLLSHTKFSKRFENPIIKQSDKNVLKELGRHIKPFILRRMKKDVLKELPEKIETKMLNEMTAEQKKVYSAYLLKAKNEFEQEVSKNGFENSRIKILSILTRMRQICCHPGLFIENYNGGSGKLEMLQELIEDAIEGGHRILLFSQFTSMLSIIKEVLNSKDVQYHYIDGSTSAEERIRLVNEFNSGDKSLFLISLKAGGTGLNLTGADMVIHFDPWWNPAVEDQATDRAYRIGQKNVVQVFKLITGDTIEEKIFQLQQKKKELIDSIIEPGENFLTKMSEDEIRSLFE
jgi:SNF2 family DNA or RNA helicase